MFAEVLISHRVVLSLRGFTNSVGCGPYPLSGENGPNRLLKSTAFQVWNHTAEK